MSASFISLRNLVVSYGASAQTRIDSLDIHEGSCHAFVGESGSGKTTVLLAMLGLLPPRVARVEGSIKIGEHQITQDDGPRMREVRRRDIAMITQSPHGSFPATMRIGRFMYLALKARGLTSSEIKDRIADSIQRVHLHASILDRYSFQISGGQAQRCAIALSVALRKPVIVADEPTSALDMTVQAGVISLLAEIRQEQRVTVVLISHDLAVVSQLADEIVVMKDGKVVEEGQTSEVLGSPRQNYTRELIRSIPVLTGAIERTSGGSDQHGESSKSS